MYTSSSVLRLLVVVVVAMTVVAHTIRTERVRTAVLAVETVGEEDRTWPDAAAA